MRNDFGKILSVAAAALAAATAVTACGDSGRKKIAQQREDWVRSLDDSITILQKKRTADSLTLGETRLRVEQAIADFTFVENPREVEGYYIYTPFRADYPLKGNAICARILKSEGLELVASSTSRFSALRATVGEKSAETETVEPDQALNYTSGGQTVVSFTGAKADSVAMLIAGAGSEAVRIEYLQPGSSQTVAATFTPTTKMTETVSRTWQLYSDRCQTHLLEKSIANDSRKIEITRMTIAAELEKKENDKK